MTWQIVLTPTAAAMIAAIRDRRLRDLIMRRIDGFPRDPVGPTDTDGRELLPSNEPIHRIRVELQIVGDLLWSHDVTHLDASAVRFQDGLGPS